MAQVPEALVKNWASVSALADKKTAECLTLATQELFKELKMKWYITKCCEFMFQATENEGWNPCFCMSTKSRLATKAEILQAV